MSIEQKVIKPKLGVLELAKQLGSVSQACKVMVSSSGVRSVWIRHDLETLKKRLKALEAKSAQEGILLTEEQLAALEKAKEKLPCKPSVSP